MGRNTRKAHNPKSADDAENAKTATRVTARVGSIASCSMHGGRGPRVAQGTGPTWVGARSLGLGIFGLWGVYGLELLGAGLAWRYGRCSGPRPTVACCPEWDSADHAGLRPSRVGSRGNASNTGGLIAGVWHQLGASQCGCGLIRAAGAKGAIGLRCHRGSARGPS